MSDSRSTDNAYIGVGLAFFPIAIALALTMDSWAIALPFAVLAVTFVILGLKPASGAAAAEGDADEKP
jgi:hypothetical protein